MNQEERGLLRFRIYYGYSGIDYIAITENELERAKYAWQTNAIFTHGTKQVKGAEFKRIEEDFRYYTGWFDTYSPKEAEDYLQLKRDMPDMSVFEKRLGLADSRVRYILNANPQQHSQLLSDPKAIDLLLLN
jgi:hypothetical protein